MRHLSSIKFLHEWGKTHTGRALYQTNLHVQHMEKRIHGDFHEINKDNMNGNTHTGKSVIDEHNPLLFLSKEIG
jgi:hypothetical protein